MGHSYYGLDGVRILLLIGLVALTKEMCPAAERPAGNGKYRSLEIARFALKSGLEFPEDYLGKMQADIVHEVMEKNKFLMVFAAEDRPKITLPPMLRLEGQVTEFDPGNRAERYLIGFGAGKTKVVVHVKVIDPTAGKTLFEDDVDGKVIMGTLGGSSSGVTRSLAKKIAKHTARFF
jgi:hypothetical protein